MKSGLVKESIYTICGLYLILSFFVILITLALEIPIIYGVLISIALIVLQFLISPYLTDLSMKWFYKAKFDMAYPDYLTSFIKEVCRKENMTYPTIGYIDDGAPNAFTYGHTKNDARIILTRGLFELLSPDEIKAVVGHELGHAVHYDMLVMTVAQLVPLVLYALYESFSYKNHKSSKKNGSIILAIIVYFFYLISNYIVLSLSRSREYYADTYSIEATNNPNALASALVRIGYGLTTAKKDIERPMPKALGIFDDKTSKTLVVSSYDNGQISRENIKQAMKWEEWNVWAKWFEFNSTHPLISKRLLAISARSREFNQEPFITFDLTPPESYVDDFLVELLINFAPVTVLTIGFVISFVMMFVDFEGGIFPIIFLVSAIIATLLGLVKFNRKRPTNSFPDRTIRDLMSEVKVSNITAIPCSLEGVVIGRGDPGFIFNEDMTMMDSTGIIFLDYNQPIYIVNKVFALFKNDKMKGKTIKVKGWFRRSPVPYVEIKSYIVDGVESQIFTYPLELSTYILLLVIEVVGIIIFL